MEYWKLDKHDNKQIILFIDQLFDKKIKNRKKQIEKLGGICCPNLLNDKCVICLNKFIKGNYIRILYKCKHQFHHNCIDSYFIVNQMKCPICRTHY